uniref:Uncharacterized protein n=1 Tax=Cucumis melo TaxID=3656 RepID=A0A9I9EIV7_CUCME
MRFSHLMSTHHSRSDEAEDFCQIESEPCPDFASHSFSPFLHKFELSSTFVKSLCLSKHSHAAIHRASSSSVHVQCSLVTFSIHETNANFDEVVLKESIGCVKPYWSN